VAWEQRASMSSVARSAVLLTILPVTQPLVVGRATSLRALPHPFTSFIPLRSPQAYEEVLEGVTSEQLTLIKWGSDDCRSCRAALRKINSVVTRWDAVHMRGRFFSMDLRRGGRSEARAAMFECFQRRNVTHMPYIELYVGTKLVHTLVVPPGGTAALDAALNESVGLVQRRRRSRVVWALRRRLRECQRELTRAQGSQADAKAGDETSERLRAELRALERRARLYRRISRSAPRHDLAKPRPDLVGVRREAQTPFGRGDVPGGWARSGDVEVLGARRGGDIGEHVWQA